MISAPAQAFNTTPPSTAKPRRVGPGALLVLCALVSACAHKPAEGPATAAAAGGATASNANPASTVNTASTASATPAPAAPAGPTCERLPTMSNAKKVAVGAAVGAVGGALIGHSIKGDRGKHAVQGALGGALVGALAGSAFRNEIDVEEQPDGSVRLKIPGSLMFASGQSALSNGFQSTLTSVSQTVRRYCDVTVRVVGHTDSTGSASGNQRLSESRARAVATHMQRQGLEAQRIQALGRGALEPIASNGDEQGRQQNRRVEVFVQPPA